MKLLGRSFYIAALQSLFFLLTAWTPYAHATSLDPDDFSSLGTLNLTSGDYTFDTTAMTIVENSAPGTVLFTGVEDNQDGQADSFGGGSTTVGASGIPHIAVFTFDDITIDGTSSITIIGNRAIALYQTKNQGGQWNRVPLPNPPGESEGGATRQGLHPGNQADRAYTG